MDEGIKEQFKNVHARIDKVDEVLERVRERLPLWVTWIMTFGGCAIGALVTWLITCMKP